ncbi:MAG: nitroreductase family protein [Chlamydiales bacterium]|nr:nitroreductase family protein [Chlamydiales bacterium]
MNRDKLSPEILANRKTDYPIDPLIQNRWSPRSMTGEELSDEELLPLFEAARWAPSSYNNQPWRFLYAKRNTPSWELFYNILGDFNKSWTKNAAALVVVISRVNFEHNNKPSVTHSFDAGAAWMSLALEGTSRGLVTHGMEGFDYEKARKDLEVPAGFEVLAMLAIGKRAPKEKLPPALQEREAPGPRKPFKERILEGKFRFSS